MGLIVSDNWAKTMLIRNCLQVPISPCLKWIWIFCRTVHNTILWTIFVICSLNTLFLSYRTCGLDHVSWLISKQRCLSLKLAELNRFMASQPSKHWAHFNVLLSGSIYLKIVYRNIPWRPSLVITARPLASQWLHRKPRRCVQQSSLVAPAIA